jgi:23S rRNA pseudouridine2605 synthase
VTTLSDPEGRPTVKDYLRGIKARVYPVGRLDFQSEGLLLLTDDGPLARDLMHPSRGVEKVYLVKVKGQPAPEVLLRLSRGIPLDGKRTGPARARLVRRGDNAWIEITIGEGRNRQVRRMLQAVGHPVQRLRRLGYGGVVLGRLPVGHLRVLSDAEVGELSRAAGRAAARPASGRRRSS